MTATAVRASESPWTSLRRPGAVAAATAGALTVVATVDPNDAGHYPTCPFFALTGHACPGCGSLRALHALTHGDVIAAVASNVLMVASIPLLVWLWVRWARRTWTGAPRPQPAPAAVLWGGAIAILAFWVVRNLPLGAALAP